MLKFIHNKVALDIHKYDFNTSHVKVYLKHSKNDCDSVRISIHPMLKFIHRVVQPQNNIGLDFNTSHVKVYHAFRTEAVRRRRFQYIPC